jgi:hypothetical protein
MIKRNKIAFQFFSRGGTIRHGFSIFPITIIHEELRRRDLRTQNFLFADRLTAAGKRRFTVRQTKPGVLAGVIQATNPVSVILSVGVPVGALIYAMNSESLHPLNYVHVMAGSLWTGIDIYLGFVLGPILGRLDPGQGAAVFRRLMPRMTFLMPVAAGKRGNSRVSPHATDGLPSGEPVDSCRLRDHRHNGRSVGADTVS